MRSTKYYYPQPQCDKCGKFISYEQATLEVKSDGMPEPSPEEYWTGLCEDCEDCSYCKGGTDDNVQHCPVCG